MARRTHSVGTYPLQVHLVTKNPNPPELSSSGVSFTHTRLEELSEKLALRVWFERQAMYIKVELAGSWESVRSSRRPTTVSCYCNDCAGVHIRAPKKLDRTDQNSLQGRCVNKEAMSGIQLTGQIMPSHTLSCSTTTNTLHTIASRT